MNQTPWTESLDYKKTKPITSTKTIYFSITITMVLPDQNRISLIYWPVHFVSLCFCKWIDNGACWLTHTFRTCSHCNQYGVCCFFSTSFSLASSSFTTYYCNPDLTSRDNNVHRSILIRTMKPVWVDQMPKDVYAFKRTNQSIDQISKLSLHRIYLIVCGTYAHLVTDNDDDDSCSLSSWWINEVHVSRTW